MPQSLASVYVHFIFSTFQRTPWITKSIAPQLYSYIGGIVQNCRSVLLAAGGIEDHVHLLISMSREVTLAELMRTVKSTSSGWIHDEFSELSTFAWQAGYGAFSVSYPAIDSVKQYISSQEEHHQTETFQDEYRDILRQNNVQFDERYVWD